MKNLLWILPVFMIACVGCDRQENRPQSYTNSYVSDDSDNTLRDTDNTSRNVRDRNFDTLTSGDQSESSADRTITQNIRKSLLSRNNLSMNAKNIKIITQNGVVTLRGVVANEQERSSIAQQAKNIQGVKKVDNQLDVKS